MKILISLLLGSSALASDYHFDCTLPNHTQVVASGFVQSTSESQYTTTGKLSVTDTSNRDHIFETQTFHFPWGFMVTTKFEGGELSIQNFYDTNTPIKQGNLIGELREDAIECIVRKDLFTAVGISSIGPWSDVGQDLEPGAIAFADLKAKARCSPRPFERTSEFVFAPYTDPNRINRSVSATADYKCK